MRHCSWFLACSALLVAPPSVAAVFTVGSDAACTHGNLVSAISAAAANGATLDEIRLATNLAYNAIIAPIASHSVTVRGGIFCQDAAIVQLEGLVLANTAQDGGGDPNESGNGGGVALYGCFMNQQESPPATRTA